MSPSAPQHSPRYTVPSTRPTPRPRNRLTPIPDTRLVEPGHRRQHLRITWIRAKIGRVQVGTPSAPGGPPVPPALTTIENPSRAGPAAPAHRVRSRARSGSESPAARSPDAAIPPVLHYIDQRPTTMIAHPNQWFAR